MRPRELTLAGFRSYREPVVFDLRGRRLVGIVGPIGSGKSSMLDAVTFALYGKTPVIESRTRSLIHQLADVAQVQLIFEVDGQIWRVQRAIRRKGQSQHKLERLDDDRPDAIVIETITQERPTNARIAELLGLDFGAFCRSVMLAQNRFAEFLKATPTQRNEVLKGVFGYERFERALSVARAKLAAAEATISALEGEARRLLDAKASLQEARRAEAEATERLERVEERWPGIEHAMAAALAGLETATNADAEYERLQTVQATLPDDREVETAAAAAADATDALTRAAGAVDEAAAREAAAQTTRDAVAAAGEEHRAFRELVAALDERAGAAQAAATRAEAAAAALEGAETAWHETRDQAGADAASAEAASTHAATTAAALTAAAEALHSARHADMATDLRRHLQAGAPCPVCDQLVASPPTAIEASTLAAEEAAHLRAAERADQATRDSMRAAEVAAASAARADAARVATETSRTARDEADAARVLATADLDAIRSELVDRLGEGDPRALLDERERELREAEQALTEARGAAADARAALEHARTSGASAAATLGRVAAALANAWGRLGEDAEVDPSPDEVRHGLESITGTLEVRLRAASETAERGRAEVVAAQTAVAAEREALGIGPDREPSEVRSELRAAAAAAAQRSTTLAETIAAASDIDDRLTEAQATRDLAARLTADLQPSRLLAFLLEAERAALAELGSVHLEQLTAAAYRFADDDTFSIADQNAAGATRAPDSLSGGETFLASLALALALAEMVARGGGRLDAFFLDEGFGSLDPEHLDRAMEGIERLVAGGDDRLVVVVSHVEQMRQRIEDLIELDKDPRTGDSIVVRGKAGVD